MSPKKASTPTPQPSPPADWIAAIRRDFTSGAASVFLLHGVRDCLPHGGRYLGLPEFIHRAFCGQKRTVFYDIGQGITFPTDEDEAEFKRFLSVARATRRDAAPALAYLRPIEAVPLVEDFIFTRNGTALIIDFVDKIVPEGDTRMMNFDERRLVTTFRRWASDPRLLRRNSFVFLIADSVGDVSRELYEQGASVRLVSVPLPGQRERLGYLQYLMANPGELRVNSAPEVDPASLLAVSPEVLAEATNGLTLTQIGGLVRSATPEHPVTMRVTSVHKRQAIEAEIGDLVEFVDPGLGLEAVGGVERQKELLLQTAEALREGKSDVVAKGILLTGPPGCGKTFCMECFAHDCEIPFVQLKNIFSKYVGATESNLQKVFYYLEALAPVFVFIDEFDQSYGRRVTTDGDSGVSRRVFGMFNAFLSDESHQGKIVFGAATNRPDLIDSSTLRAGRFDLKIPFMLPDEAAREAILEVTLTSLGIRHRGLKLAAIAKRTAGYSGADLREIVKTAQRRCVFDGRAIVTQKDLLFAVGDYISPNTARADEIRLMELLAIANTTSRSMLSEEQLRMVESGELYPQIEHLRRRLGP